MSLSNYFLHEEKPFTNKRDANWKRILIILGITLTVVIFAILIWPSSIPEQTVFHEKSSGGAHSDNANSADPTHETARQMQDARMNSHQVHSSLDHLYRQDRSSGQGGTGTPNRNAGMILARNGFDSRTQLSPGTRVQIRLVHGVTVAEQAMPVVGTVMKDVEADSGVAIPGGSKVLGEVSFEATNERTTLTWKSVILADGRERPLSAIGIGKDGKSGLDARIRSESFKNAVGQTMTKFVGAYAAGSINTGMFGANPGGNKNGLRNAITQTATERANAMGETLQKEKKWTELQAGQEIIAILNQPFSFRDPGGVYGQ